MAQIVYQNQNATRNQQLSPQLTQVLQVAADANGIDRVVVISGGQPSEGPNRTGSHRHDEGGAADIRLYRNGRLLNFEDPNDRPTFQAFIGTARSNGATGFGAGVDYMGPNTIHVGFGTPAVWGAGGRGANAPDWLRAATSGDMGGPVRNYAGTMAAGKAPFLEALRTRLQANGRQTPFLDRLIERRQAASQSERPVLDWVRNQRQGAGMDTPILNQRQAYQNQTPAPTMSEKATPPPQIMPASFDNGAQQFYQQNTVPPATAMPSTTQPMSLAQYASMMPQRQQQTPYTPDPWTALRGGAPYVPSGPYSPAGAYPQIRDVGNMLPMLGNPAAVRALTPF